MPRLLVVHHTSSPAPRAMPEAERGGDRAEILNLESALGHPWPEDVRVSGPARDDFSRCKFICFIRTKCCPKIIHLCPLPEALHYRRDGVTWRCTLA